MPPPLRLAILVIVVAAAVAAVMAQAPIRQPLAYHDFADGRALLGVPNLLNVATNLPFLVVGLMAVVCQLARTTSRPESAGASSIVRRSGSPTDSVPVSVGLTSAVR